MGENITKTIFERGILKSHIVLVFLSRNSIISDWVKFEMLVSNMLNKIIIPIIIDSEIKKMFYNDDLAFINLKDIKYLTLSGKVEKDFNRLIKELKIWRWKLCYNYAINKATYGYDIFVNEDDFYEFASKLILPKSNNIIFKASTPALLLKGELYTPNRQEYISRLLWEYNTNITKKGIYLFDYRRTSLEFKNNLRGMFDNIIYARKTLKEIQDTNLGIYPINPPFSDILPSTILGENHGLIILRDPVKHEFAGVIHISGKILDDIRKFYYSILSKFHLEYRNLILQLLTTKIIT